MRFLPCAAVERYICANGCSHSETTGITTGIMKLPLLEMRRLQPSLYKTPMLTELAISGYRSLRNLVIPLKGLNLITAQTEAAKRASIVRCGYWQTQPRAMLSNRSRMRAACHQRFGRARKKSRG